MEVRPQPDQGDQRGLDLFFEWAGGNSPSFSSEAFQYGISTGAFGPDTPALGGYGSASFQNQLSTGFNYTTLSKLNIILSYNYNQAGLSRAEWNRWFAMGKPGAPNASLASNEFWYMRTYGSEMRQLEDRQTAFLRIEQDDLVLRHLSFATFVVADLETHSYLLNASLDYRISDRWRVQFQAEESSARSSPNSAATARAVSTCCPSSATSDDAPLASTPGADRDLAPTARPPASLSCQRHDP